MHDVHNIFLTIQLRSASASILGCKSILLRYVSRDGPLEWAKKLLKLTPAHANCMALGIVTRADHLYILGLAMKKSTSSV